jgi:adenylate kinase family enzyme
VTGSKRIAIIGTTGSGKSSLAEKVAERMGIPLLELDGLYWQPGWLPPNIDEFRTAVQKLVESDRWVSAGNYSIVRDLIWTRADTVVWLDFPLVVPMWRLFWRSIRRSLSKEDLWGSGNVETFRQQFLSRDSLFFWAWKTRGRHQRELPGYFAQPEYAHLHVVHLRSPWQVDQWLKVLPESTSGK